MGILRRLREWREDKNGTLIGPDIEADSVSTGQQVIDNDSTDSSIPLEVAVDGTPNAKITDDDKYLFGDFSAYESNNNSTDHEADMQKFHVYIDGGFTPEFEASGPFNLKLEGGGGYTNLHYEQPNSSIPTLSHGVRHDLENAQKPWLLGIGADVFDAVDNNDVMLSVTADGNNRIGRGTESPSYAFDMNNGNVGNVIQLGNRVSDNQFLAFNNDGSISLAVDGGGGAQKEMIDLPQGDASNQNIQLKENIELNGNLIRKANDETTADAMTADPESGAEDGYITYVGTDNNTYQIPIYSA